MVAPILPTLAQTSDLVEPKIHGEQTAPAMDAGAEQNGEALTGQPPLDKNVAPPSKSGGFGPLLMIGLMMAVFFFILMGGQRKEKKKRKNLLASIKKGDKVQTVGGMLGTIVEMRDSEIVLKVDENANTRIKFNRTAIQAMASDRTSD